MRAVRGLTRRKMPNPHTLTSIQIVPRGSGFRRVSFLRHAYPSSQWMWLREKIVDVGHEASTFNAKATGSQPCYDRSKRLPSGLHRISSAAPSPQHRDADGVWVSLGPEPSPRLLSRQVDVACRSSPATYITGLTPTLGITQRQRNRTIECRGNTNVWWGGIPGPS